MKPPSQGGVEGHTLGTRSGGHGSCCRRLRWAEVRRMGSGPCVRFCGMRPGGAGVASHTGGGKSEAFERLNLQTWSLNAATRKPPITTWIETGIWKGEEADTGMKMSIREACMHTAHTHTDSCLIDLTRCCTSATEADTSSSSALALGDSIRALTLCGFRALNSILLQFFF